MSKAENELITEVQKEIKTILRITNNYRNNETNSDLVDFTDVTAYNDYSNIFFPTIADVFADNATENLKSFLDKHCYGKTLSLSIDYGKNVKRLDFSYMRDVKNDYDFENFFSIKFEENMTFEIIEPLKDSTDVLLKSLLPLYKTVAENYQFFHLKHEELSFLKKNNLLDAFISGEEETCNIMYLNFENSALIDFEQKKISENIISLIDEKLKQLNNPENKNSLKL